MRVNLWTAESSQGVIRFGEGGMVMKDYEAHDIAEMEYEVGDAMYVISRKVRVGNEWMSRMFAGEKRSVEERLPMFNGVDPAEYEEANRVKKKRRGGHGNSKYLRNRDIVEEGPNINKDVVAKLVLMLNEKRYTEYRHWSRLCWILKGLGEEYQDLFLLASSKSGKFNSWSCDKLWARSEFRGLGVATLQYWAKKDNPEEYRSVMSTERNKGYLESLVGHSIEEVF